ncbi:MAG: HAMP domain-containing protein [Lentisphaeria bacterium]|nr:HAMP domain-containing protein [Lentisphaeria bacterium]
MDIKRKFLTSFAVLLLLIGAVGFVMTRQVRQLGDSIDVILRENYSSVIYCQRMNDALERIDSGILREFSGRGDRPEAYFDEHIRALTDAWRAERDNVTVPGERELVEAAAKLVPEYVGSVRRIVDPAVPGAERRRLYREKAFPLFEQLRGLSGQVLALNQKNMSDANDRARVGAEQLHARVIAIVAAALLFAVVLTLLLKSWIEKPIHRLIQLATDISNGNLDIVLDTKSNDEIGRLSRAFNAMAAALREARRSDRMKLERSERTNRDVFRELPTPIAIVDAKSGTVEIATQSADRCFGLKTGVGIHTLGISWLDGIFDRVVQTGAPCVCGENGGVIQHFIGNREYFFQPTAVPVPADAPPERISGVAVILKDVTLAHEQQELKKSVISTVSHQFRTPLTSLQMSIYLLLEEKIGPLNPDQLDLVMAMRDDSERLSNIIGDLLDLNRASSRTHLKFEPRRPEELLREAESRFRAACLDRDIRLEVRSAPALPEIPVAVNRIGYVFDNLIGNAIRFTPPGGTITLEAEPAGDAVRFTVRDTGRGMPEEVRRHVFEQFYRAPGQEPDSGAGLGLSIVKEIITAMAGTIEVESAEGRGSSFIFTLPLVQEGGGGEKDVEWV